MFKNHTCYGPIYDSINNIEVLSDCKKIRKSALKSNYILYACDFFIL